MKEAPPRGLGGTPKKMFLAVSDLRATDFFFLTDRTFFRCSTLKVSGRLVQNLLCFYFNMLYNT